MHSPHGHHYYHRVKRPAARLDLRGYASRMRNRASMATVTQGLCGLAVALGFAYVAENLLPSGAPWVALMMILPATAGYLVRSWMALVLVPGAVVIGLWLAGSLDPSMWLGESGQDSSSGRILFAGLFYLIILSGACYGVFLRKLVDDLNWG